MNLDEALEAIASAGGFKVESQYPRAGGVTLQRWGNGLYLVKVVCKRCTAFHDVGEAVQKFLEEADREEGEDKRA